MAFTNIDGSQIDTLTPVFEEARIIVLDQVVSM